MTDRPDEDRGRDRGGHPDGPDGPRRPPPTRDAEGGSAGPGRPPSARDAEGDPAGSGRRPSTRDAGGGSGGPRRPLSAREVGGEPARPGPPPSVRDAQGGRGRSGSGAPRPARAGRGGGSREEDDDEKRPTPVRAAMGVAREETQPREVPTRAFPSEAEEGEGWIVREAGRTSSGQPTDPSAPLIFLTFARADEPDTPVREALAVGRSLEGLTEAELEAVLERARPLAPKTEPEEIFPGTRRSRGSGRRR